MTLDKQVVCLVIDDMIDNSNYVPPHCLLGFTNNPTVHPKTVESFCTYIRQHKHTNKYTIASVDLRVQS